MNGFLLIDKPIGMTSFDVVRRVKRVFGTKKVGHAGTLDPDASGLLLVAVNHATRLLRFLVLEPKVYEFEIVLGTQTNTDDAVGEVIAEAPYDVNRDEIRAVLPMFSGEIKQRPPLFSAIHIDGVRAYKKARAGEDFEIPERDVEVFRIECLAFDGDIIKMRASVSSGTYIRSIARDFGAALHTKAHARAIRRVALANYTIEGSVRFETLAVEDLADAVRILESSLGLLNISTKDQKRLRSGLQINFQVEEDMETNTFLGLVHEGDLFGVAEAIQIENRNLRLQPRVVFPD